MRDTNELAKDADYAFSHGYSTEYHTGQQGKMTVEMLREERVKNLLGILNTPWVAQRLDERTQESIIDTLAAVAKVYNEELKNDPTIKQALPKEHNVDDELNKMFK